ncbi:MAG TPA: dicarboxylate/amino acid:cation symporter [Gemmatimonadaceae bacterium]|nr:dicarboxylate/amino acid:cation symporter [Gemmatimonadaceae bacterium]
MSLTKRVVIALALGLIGGMAVAASGDQRLFSLVSFLEPLGTLWVNAIRMTVVPLVVSLLIVGVASVSDMSTIGRMGARTLTCFVLLLLMTATLAVIIVPPIFTLLQIDPSSSASLRAAESAAGTAGTLSTRQLPTFGQWLVDVIPTNPVKAAADGAMLPLVIFSLLFSIALTRIASDTRAPVVHFFRAVSDAMLIIVRWIISLAPIGVFVLALALASRLGAIAAGAMAFYVVVVCSVFILVLVLLYPVAAIFGRVSVTEFARAASAPQAVAVSTRSSLASLPALIDSAERGLGLPPAVSGFVLPLAVATFKVTTPPTYVVGALFVAHLYGVQLSVEQIVTLAALGVILSFSAPGIPSGGLIVLASVFPGVGLPVEAIGILIALDVFPDAARTVANVTADLAVATIVARRESPEMTIAAAA